MIVCVFFFSTAFHTESRKKTNSEREFLQANNEKGRRARLETNKKQIRGKATYIDRSPSVDHRDSRAGDSTKNAKNEIKTRKKKGKNDAQQQPHYSLLHLSTNYLEKQTD